MIKAIINNCQTLTSSNHCQNRNGSKHGNDIGVEKKCNYSVTQARHLGWHLLWYYTQVKMKFVFKLETKLKFKRWKFLEERKRLRINDLVKIETRDIQRKTVPGSWSNESSRSSMVQLQFHQILPCASRFKVRRQFNVVVIRKRLLFTEWNVRISDYM